MPDQKRPRVRVATALAVAAVAGVTVAVVVADGGGPAVDEVSDETGAITVNVPEGWGDVERSPFTVGDRTYPYVQAAPDLDAYHDDPGAPGLEVLLVEGLGRQDVDRLLDETAERLRAPRECEGRDRRPFEQRGFEGSLEVYTRCGDAGTELWLLVAANPRDDALVVAGIQGADPELRQRVLDSVTRHA